MDLLKTLLYALRLTTERLVAILLASVFLLVAGDSVLGTLGFSTWDTWRPWAGVALLLSAASLIVRGAKPVVTRSVARRVQQHRALKALPHLSSEERRILRLFEQERTQQLGKGSGTAAELERLGFLRRLEGATPYPEVEVYAIEDWAWKHMREHSESWGNPEISGE